MSKLVPTTNGVTVAMHSDFCVRLSDMKKELELEGLTDAVVIERLVSEIADVLVQGGSITNPSSQQKAEFRANFFGTIDDIFNRCLGTRFLVKPNLDSYL